MIVNLYYFSGETLPDVHFGHQKTSVISTCCVSEIFAWKILIGFFLYDLASDNMTPSPRELWLWWSSRKHYLDLTVIWRGSDILTRTLPFSGLHWFPGTEIF